MGCRIHYKVSGVPVSNVLFDISGTGKCDFHLHVCG